MEKWTEQAQNPYVDGLLREVVQLPDRFGYPQGVSLKTRHT